MKIDQETLSRLARPRKITVVIIILSAIAAGGGLLIPGTYRDAPRLIPAIMGQDLITLLMLPFLIIILIAVKYGSVRSIIIWVGFLSYLLYTYTGASFAYAFNIFFPFYIALFSLCLYTLIAFFTAIDIEDIRNKFDEKTPKIPVMLYFISISVFLTIAYLAQIIPFYTEGRLPRMIHIAETPTSFVYVLDFGIVIPLMLVTSYWIWIDYAWGYVLTGILLIKSATMGLALLSMTLFTLLSDFAIEPGLTLLWFLIAAGGLYLTVWYFRHCHDDIW